MSDVEKYKIKVIEKMAYRVNNYEDMSDSDFFTSLLYFGELTLKTVVSGLIAGIVDGRDRKQYSLKYKLVRANGLGEWVTVLDEILLGPTATHLVDSANRIKNELTVKVNDSKWQHEASSLMNSVVALFDPNVDKIGHKTNIRSFFSNFILLRNKTRGHGAQSIALYPKANTKLKTALDLFVNNFTLFDLEWAYLKQNLSGKYNVVRISETTDQFSEYKRGKQHNIKKPDGVYVVFDEPRRIDLIDTDVELHDFYFPNGSFTKNKYELISYITGSTKNGNSKNYLSPADELPLSETRGLGGLEVQGLVFSNIPPAPANYIRRTTIENDLSDTLNDERHPVVTLHGRGGIGKTSTVIQVLHDISQESKFELILWFSARDIDLITAGAKKVKPDVLTIKEISNEFVKLIEPDERNLKSFDQISYFKESLSTVLLDKPCIYVFDNFETLKDPIETFNWINANIRLPNKIIITTRHREFKGDYPIEVLGMNEKESYALIDSYCEKLGIINLITSKYKDLVYQKSDGHPYIIKILLGEIKKNKTNANIEKVIASNPDVLNALFDRTFSNLSKAAVRVFLTLCNWRSAIPQIALEAVLLRADQDGFDVSKAVEELENYSFIEKHTANNDETDFLSIPLAASIFGKRKFSVSPYKISIMADTEILHLLGASQPADINKGLLPKLDNLIKQVLNKAKYSTIDVSIYLSILEFIAQNYYPAWLKISDLVIQLDSDTKDSEKYIRKFLEFCKEDSEKMYAWEKLSRIYRKAENKIEELHCLSELCNLKSIDIQLLSDSANRVNSLLFNNKLLMDTDEKRILIKDIADKFYKRLNETDSDDCSRLGWLYMNMNDEDMAKKVCQIGLKKDPYNYHCQKLISRI